uniref:EGF-like domain-containing protein n=1 Tax=Ciona savignyi TaxID=51511 RepID=H2Z7Z2_CIOSA
MNRTAKCHHKATCRNTVGNYTCTCKPGYSGNGHYCADIDECKDGTAKCDTNAICNNTDGSYTCTCNVGFTGSGKSCTTITKCTIDGVYQCHKHAKCLKDSDGSFNCQCNNGFTGSGEICSGVCPQSTLGEYTFKPAKDSVTQHSNEKCSNGLSMATAACALQQDGSSKFIDLFIIPCNATFLTVLTDGTSEEKITSLEAVASNVQNITEDEAVSVISFLSNFTSSIQENATISTTTFSSVAAVSSDLMKKFFRPSTPKLQSAAKQEKL